MSPEARTGMEGSIYNENNQLVYQTEQVDMWSFGVMVTQSLTA